MKMFKIIKNVTSSITLLSIFSEKKWIKPNAEKEKKSALPYNKDP
jgi:hypothetical protein